MWQRFTEPARKLVFYAQEEAGRLGENAVGPEHLLLGMARVPDSVGALMLEQLGVSLEAVRTAIEANLTRGAGRQGQDMQLTPAAKRVIDLAYEEAKRLKNNYIGVEHLLLGMLRGNDDLAARTLTDLGITLEAARARLLQMQDGGEASPLAGKLQDMAASMKAAFSPETDVASEELLSLDEAVKFLGTSKPTLYRLLGQDEIKGLKVGRQWRFRKADLITYMERGPVAIAAPPREDIQKALAFLQHEATTSDWDVNDDDVMQIGIITRLLILGQAIDEKASDIHLEPTQDDLRLRRRVDGVLQGETFPGSLRESLTAEIKTMAGMDVNEKRLPQDGRISLRHKDKDFDIRVASVPSMYGEAITLRILAKQDILLGLDNLGLVSEDLRQLRDLMHQPNGIVLATGPAGSGKTTLLYSCLQEAAGIEKKTMTVEDPVEFILPYTTQTQVNKKAGLSFATALRSFRRQDPDVILVGEMRDLETAQIAAELSLTGHLLLTALHTGDAPSALLRLLDMGVEPYLVGATVAGVVATRLVRQVCDNCKQPVDLSGEPGLGYVAQLAREGGYEIPADAVFVRGVGCEQCRGRGFRGRTGLYEVLPMTEALTEALLRRAPVEELTDIAVAGGMRTLLADGIRKAAEGLTTIEEVMRVVTVSV